jgi:hypothetical protein
MAQQNTNLFSSVGSTLGALGSASTLTGMGGTALMTTPLGLGIAGLGVMTSLFGAGSEQKEAQEKLKIIDKQSEALKESEKSVSELGSIRKGIVTADTSREYKSISKAAGQTLEKVKKSESEAYRKTDLAFSGAIEEGTEESRKLVREKTEEAGETLFSQLGAKMLAIDTDISGQLGDIKERMAALGAERKQTKKASSSYLYNLLT